MPLNKNQQIIDSKSQVASNPTSTQVASKSYAETSWASTIPQKPMNMDTFWKFDNKISLAQDLFFGMRSSLSTYCHAISNRYLKLQKVLGYRSIQKSLAEFVKT